MQIDERERDERSIDLDERIDRASEKVGVAMDKTSGVLAGKVVIVCLTAFLVVLLVIGAFLSVGSTFFFLLDVLLIVFTIWMCIQLLAKRR